MKFSELPLAEPLLKSVADEGYHTATPIQAKTIPQALTGRDVLGCAQTGTGKTAAFALPILHQLADNQRGKQNKLPRALVLAPTRELAQQIADSFATYGRRTRLGCTVIYGGVAQSNQVRALRRGVDIVVATPGRLLDLIQQGHCDLSAVSAFVLDEADRMLDMGFIPDIKRIITHLPAKKQTMLFSATMPREIRRLADALLHQPVDVTVAAKSPAVERIEQSVYHVDKPKKAALLAHLTQTLSISRAIVFTRTKHGADRVARHLKRSGSDAEAIHGNKTQGARRRALDNFRNGKVHILVATDIAARGIDVDDVSHVFNYDLCRDAESHVHRIGRTARAGAEGAAISFCDREELSYLRAIERLLRMEITVIGEQPSYAKAAKPKRVSHPLDRAGKKPRRRRRSSQAQQGAGGDTPRRKKKSHHRGQSNKAKPSGTSRNGGGKAKKHARQGAGAASRQHSTA